MSLIHGCQQRTKHKAVPERFEHHQSQVAIAVKV